eukprot:18510-Amorphochlora_amoeboformis.AAC.1
MGTFEQARCVLEFMKSYTLGVWLPPHGAAMGMAAPRRTPECESPSARSSGSLPIATALLQDELGRNLWE